MGKVLIGGEFFETVRIGGKVFFINRHGVKIEFNIKKSKKVNCASLGNILNSFLTR